jgi:hypothetical protein
MDTAGSTSTVTRPAPGRRADAGSVRLGERDVAGLLLCGDMYGAPYDLLAAFLGVREDRARGIVARWRRAGYAATGRLGPGPAWCWLTRSGLAVTGQHFAPGRPALGRLAHIRGPGHPPVPAGQRHVPGGAGVVAQRAAHPRRRRRPGRNHRARAGR